MGAASDVSITDGPMNAIANSEPKRTSPTISFGLRRAKVALLRNRVGFDRTLGTGIGIDGSDSSVLTTMLSLIVPMTELARVDDARIEQRIDQIQNQCHQRDRKDHQQYDTVDQEIVDASDRAVKQRPNPWVAKDHLD